jgi:hypothetical protein
MLLLSLGLSTVTTSPYIPMASCVYMSQYGYDSAAYLRLRITINVYDSLVSQMSTDRVRNTNTAKNR